MNKSYPLLPLRDIVIFPHMIAPLFVGRSKSVAALERAMQHGKVIFLLTQRDQAEEDPKRKDLYDVGVVASILQMLKLPDGTVRVLIEGKVRAQLEDIEDVEDITIAHIGPVTAVRTQSQPAPEKEEKEEMAEGMAKPPVDSPAEAEAAAQAAHVTRDSPVDIKGLMRSVLGQFEEYAKLSKRMTRETAAQIGQISDPAQFSDSIASHLNIKVADKQELLAEISPAKRLQMLLSLMDGEFGVLEIEKKIRGRVKRQMEKNQREYYLNEQMKAIQRELGNDPTAADSFAEIEERIEKTKLSKEAKSAAESELKKLRAMPPMSAESTVVRNYLDVLLGLPWGKKTKLKKDISQAQQILDDEHYGLEKVKERIIEYLAVQTRTNQLKGPILCLVGAPGVGKTSLGRSIARATGRKFVHHSLGGVRDEADIRGHRRTYIGSLPGKIAANLKKAGTMNPLFLLDEIDKMGQDFRGDPASALLEVLDPEQNSKFQDHYLEIDIDLSNVMFMTTANSLNLPQPLLDRMEVIRLEGYTEDEKVEIAQRHLLERQIKAHGLRKGEFSLSDDGLRSLIRYYTREAGVRTLDRELARLVRKSLRQILEDDSAKTVSITTKNLADFAGVRKFRHGMSDKEDQIGAVTGLAWTEVGGELLTIEAVTAAGKGQIRTTGKLGEVMTESVQAALSFVKSRAPSFGIRPDIFSRKDIHIHLPEGAVPKDGPSAGVGMVTAMVSTLTGIPIKKDVAMTGEVTLRGRVLAIGGLKEKLLAAMRGGISTALIPQENEKDLQEIPENITKALNIIPVAHVDEVLARSLVAPLVPIEWSEADELAAIPTTLHTSDSVPESTVRH